MSDRDIIWVCQRLDQRGYVANHDGNVSVRRDGGTFLVTPTARGKCELTPNDLIEIDIDGRTVSGQGHVFSEWKIHRAIYEGRPEVTSVVHAHPIAACALGIQQKPLIIDYMTEAFVSLGEEVPCLPRMEMLCDLQLKLVSRVAPLCMAFLVPGNGVFSLGTDLRTNYLRLELVEHLAQIFAQLPKKNLQKIPAEERRKVVAKHREYIAKTMPSRTSDTVVSTTSSQVSGQVDEDWMNAIVSKVVASLEKQPNA